LSEVVIWYANTSGWNAAIRDSVTTAPKETRGTERLELRKYCKKLRRHTVHKESRKK